jgi:hypothetical protein
LQGAAEYSKPQLAFSSIYNRQYILEFISSAIVLSGALGEKQGQQISGAYQA